MKVGRVASAMLLASGGGAPATPLQLPPERTCVLRNTSLTLNTNNPSDNDNISLEAFLISGTART
jgi:hypothetical protein